MHSQKTQSIIVGILIMIGVVVSLGKIHYAINPFARTQLLNRFIQTVEQDKAIDPEQFWEFRDFYAATTSTFNPNNIRIKKPFLSMVTSYMNSNDYLLPPDADTALDASPYTGKGVKIHNSDTLVFIEGRRMYIRFKKPLDEMQKANGFFRYFGVDLEKYKDYVWYNDTVIHL